MGGDGRPLIDGLYWPPGDWLVRRGYAPFMLGGPIGPGPIPGIGPWPYWSSSSLDAVREFARDSACIVPRSTAPYRFDEHAMSVSSRRFSPSAGTLLIWLVLLRPKLGLNLLARGCGSASPCGLFLTSRAEGGAFRFFRDVTLIMSKLSGSIRGCTMGAIGST